MCLNRVDFALYSDKELQTYVGKGFKSLDRDYEKFDVWQEATGGMNEYFRKTNGIGLEDDFSVERRYYPPGFHIFLKEISAAKYNNVIGNRDASDYMSTYEVSYCDVLAFGNNDAGNTNYACVIARYMFVHSTPLRDAYGKLEYNIKTIIKE